MDGHCSNKLIEKCLFKNVLILINGDSHTKQNTITECTKQYPTLNNIVANMDTIATMFKAQIRLQLPLRDLWQTSFYNSL